MKFFYSSHSSLRKIPPLVWAAFFLWSLQALAQPDPAIRRLGEALFLEKKYGAAQPLLSAAFDPSNPALCTRLAICHWHLNQLDEADSLLRLALGSEETGPAEAFLYAAKVRHARHDFERAAFFYKEFLRKTPSDHPLRGSIKDDIRRCGTGLRWRRQAPMAAVVNLGEPLNSPAEERHPLPSPDGALLLFASDRAGAFGCPSGDACASDLLLTRLREGDWTPPHSPQLGLNSAGQEAPLCWGRDGKRLYFLRKMVDGTADILACDAAPLDSGDSLSFRPAAYPLRPNEGDTDLFFFGDSLLLFSSRREGGMGGLDLWYCVRSAESWLVPQNLGLPLNSPYDEAAPFLASDGRTLYFSSNDPARSLGGSDLLRSTFFEQNGRWSEPQNLGLPLNSAADESHFSLSGDGERAFFSSSRKSGLGGHDLYVAIFEEPRVEQGSRQAGFPFSSSNSKDGGEAASSDTPVPNMVEPKSLRYRVKIPLNGDDLDMEALVQRFPEGEQREGCLLAGSYFSFQSAEALRKDLNANGHAQASVAAFLDGREVTKEKAGAWVGKFPDLINFIEN